jgi:hypothetical protein
MKVSPAAHCVLDYALALAFLAFPAWLNFSPQATRVSYITGALYLAASLITRYPGGLLKRVPFPAHGVFEAIMAVCWLAVPWLLGFAEDDAARNFFVLAGLGLLCTISLTRYQEPAIDHSTEDRRQLIADRRQQSLPVARNRRLALDDRRAVA